ncbi:hypothetical protein [Burkholderia territorii]|uniref:hypothetical protein n=1 Tax=Burkholderia territorii TaxID=1503055 RepID=UPI0012D88938|nr:hypothetical protein [Burkholderia territorii]
MQVRVKLSSDPLIEFFSFCQAIAEAVYPTAEKGLEGLDCVIGKLVTRHVSIPESAGKAFRQYGANWQSVLTSSDGRTLNELLPSDKAVVNEPAVSELPFHEPSPPQIGEITLRYELSDGDREAFARVLKVLKDLKVTPLRYPMSEEERAEFIEAYCKLPNRPMWMPVLVTEETINRRKSEHDAAFFRHQRALTQDFEAGRLTPVNAYHAPVATLVASTFIPRAQAIAYLERHGFAYGDPLDNRSDGDLSNTQTKEQSDSGSNRWQPGERKLSPETVPELVKFHNELKEADKNRGTGKRIPFVKLTAERFGVSRRYVSEVVKRAGEAVTEEGRIDHLLVGKPQSL